MSGNGDVILMVFAFRARKSITVRNSGTRPILVPGFGISNIGTVLRALVIFQRPDLSVMVAMDRFYSHQSREFHD